MKCCTMQALTHIYLGAFVWPANFIQNANMLVKKVLITRYILQYLECIRLKEEELGWDFISLFLKIEKKMRENGSSIKWRAHD